MNKIYRTVYNETTGTWMAVAEIAKGHTKSAGGNIVSVSSTITSVPAVGMKLVYTALASAVLLMSTQAMAATVADGTGSRSIAIQGVEQLPLQLLQIL